jgi:hypothetical protein
MWMRLLSTRPSIILGPAGLDRDAHRKGRLDPLNERPLHELLFGKHTGRLYLRWRAER